MASPAETRAVNPADQEARTRAAKRISDLVVFLVPFTSLAVVWWCLSPQTWFGAVGPGWPLLLVFLLFAGNYLWRFGLAVALRVLLSQRGQTLHTAREPGDPEVWGRLRELVASIQAGQGAAALNPESDEYRSRARAVHAGLRAEAAALWGSLRESRTALSQRIRVAARDVAHGSSPLGVSSIFGGGAGKTLR